MARGHHNNQLDKEQLANGELEYRFNFIPLRIDTRCYDKGVIEAINQISRYEKLMRNRKKGNGYCSKHSPTSSSFNAHLLKHI